MKSTYYSGGVNAPIYQHAIPRKRILGLFAFFTLLFAVFAGTYTTTISTASTTEAAGFSSKIMCDSKSLGYGMNDKGAWKSALVNIPASDVAGRTFTAQEIFGGNVGFITYYGEGEGTDWTQAVGNAEERNIDKGDMSSAQDKLDSARTGTACVLGSISSSIGGIQVALTSFISSLGQMLSTAAFDPTIFCKDENDTSCINIVGVIGGENNNGGIIGALTEGILLPLSTLMALIAAIVIFITRMRTPMQGLIDFGILVLVYIIGVMGATNPQVVAKAPMQIAAVILQTAITPFTQGVGLSDNGTAQGNGICVSSAPGASIDAQMSMTVSQLNCTAWKAFVLNPYAQAQFGRSYDELELSDPDIASAAEKAGYAPEDFNVSMGTSSAPEEMYNKTLTLDAGSPTVQNLAMYQLYLKTNAAQTGDEQYLTAPVDTRWYRVILTAANDDDIWQHYSFSMDSMFYKAGIGFIALIATIAGTIIIAFTSILALAWLFIGMIALSLFPLFILLGLEPRFGRRILKSYAWDVFNAILKYFVSLVFVILTIVVYGAILSTIDNIGMLLLAVIIVTAALAMYRSTIMGMFGDMNMLSAGSVGGRLGSLVDKGKKTLVSATGGGLGTAIAEQGFVGALNPLNMRKNMGSFAQGGISSTKRELKRGSGVLANALRERDRISDDNRKDLRERTEHVRNDLQDNQAKLQQLANEYGHARSEADSTANAIADTENARDAMLGNIKAVHEAREEILLRFDANTAGAQMFARQQEAMNELGRIESELENPNYYGLTEADVVGRRARANELTQELNNAENLVLPDSVQNEMDRAKADYEARIASALSGMGISDITPEMASAILAYNNDIAELTAKHHTLQSDLDKIAERHSEVLEQGAILAQEYQNMRDASLEWKPGKFMGREAIDNAVHKDPTKQDVEQYAKEYGVSEEEAYNQLAWGAFNNYTEENRLSHNEGGDFGSDTIVHGTGTGEDVVRDKTLTQPIMTVPSTPPVGDSGASNNDTEPEPSVDSAPVSGNDQTVPLSTTAPTHGFNDGLDRSGQNPYSAPENVTPESQGLNDSVAPQGTPTITPSANNNATQPSGDITPGDTADNGAPSDMKWAFMPTHNGTIPSQGTPVVDSNPEPQPAPQAEQQPAPQTVTQQTAPANAKNVTTKPAPQASSGFTQYAQQAPQEPTEQLGFFTALSKELVEGGAGNLANIPASEREEILPEVERVTQRISSNGGTVQDMKEFAQQIHDSDGTTIEKVISSFADRFKPKH